MGAFWSIHVRLRWAVLMLPSNPALLHVHTPSLHAQHAAATRTQVTCRVQGCPPSQRAPKPACMLLTSIPWGPTGRRVVHPLIVHPLRWRICPACCQDTTAQEHAIVGGGSYLFAQKGSWGTKWVFLFAAMYRLMIVRLCCKGWECGMGDIPSIGTEFCAWIWAKFLKLQHPGCLVSVHHMGTLLFEA